MNGAHDMGGVMGHGPINPEQNEPVFHGRWEERVLAMTVAMGPVGGWNIDQSRFARENVRPVFNHQPQVKTRFGIVGML